MSMTLTEESRQLYEDLVFALAGGDDSLSTPQRMELCFAAGKTAEDLESDVALVRKRKAASEGGDRLGSIRRRIRELEAEQSGLPDVSAQIREIRERADAEIAELLEPVNRLTAELQQANRDEIAELGRWQRWQQTLLQTADPRIAAEIQELSGQIEAADAELGAAAAESRSVMNDLERRERALRASETFGADLNSAVSLNLDELKRRAERLKAESDVEGLSEPERGAKAEKWRRLQGAINRIERAEAEYRRASQRHAALLKRREELQTRQQDWRSVDLFAE